MDSKCGQMVMKRPRWKGFEFAEPHFHPATAAIWKRIAVLRRFCHTVAKIEIATETPFSILEQNQKIQT